MEGHYPWGTAVASIGSIDIKLDEELRNARAWYLGNIISGACRDSETQIEKRMTACLPKKEVCTISRWFRVIADVG